jgi:hypothetical protein
VSAPNPEGRRVSRESRLLLLTVAVCALVLLLLARLRFADAPQFVDTSAPPLERLAARASYDALAADIQRVEASIGPALVALRVVPRMRAAPRELRDVLAVPGAAPAVRHAVALRIAPGTAVGLLDPEAAIAGIAGGEPAAGPADVLAVDPIRHVARIRVPDSAAPQVPPVALSSIRPLVYVVAVEGTQAGVTLRPVFLGRGDRFAVARWPQPLLPLGGLAVAPGALLFTLAGEFIGGVVTTDGAAAVAGARDLLETAERLASASGSTPATLGVAVQALTPTLAEALGVPHGIVVAEVDSRGAAAGMLEQTDVITAVDEESTGDPDELLLRLAARRPGEIVSLAVVRGGETVVVRVPLAALDSSPQGVAFVREPGAGTRAVAGDEFAGLELQPGDVVLHADGVADPTPAQVRRRLARSGGEAWTVLTIRRDGRQRVVAVRPAPSTRAASR